MTAPGQGWPESVAITGLIALLVPSLDIPEGAQSWTEGQVYATMRPEHESSPTDLVCSRPPWDLRVRNHRGQGRAEDADGAAGPA